MWQGDRDGLRAASAGGAGWRRRRLRGRVGTAKRDVSAPSWYLWSPLASSAALTTSPGLHSVPRRVLRLRPGSPIRGAKREHLVTALAQAKTQLSVSQSVALSNGDGFVSAVGSACPSSASLPPSLRYSLSGYTPLLRRAKRP